MIALPDYRQRRILTSLASGDLIWEVAGQIYFTQFNERSGRPGKVRFQEVQLLTERGWTRRISHDPAARHLDYYEITETGRQALAGAVATRIGPRNATGLPKAGRRTA